MVQYTPADVSTPGVKEVVATCGTSAATCSVSVVKLERVTYNKPHCWDGEEITFTAVPVPSGTVFPNGSPIWIATVGSFPGGNTGPSVVWKAPTGCGENATITAQCGASSAGERVTYVYISMPTTGGALLREATHSFSASVEPAEYFVELCGVSTPSELGLSISGLAITYENLIRDTDIDVHANRVAAQIEAVLSGCSGKIFGFEYDLQKWFSDWYANVTVFDGQFAYDTLVDAVAEEVGNRVAEAAKNQCFNSSLSSELGDLAEFQTKSWLLLADPFPGSVTNSVIPEGATFSWSLESSVTMEAGTITIKEVGYPGWPELSPPSISEWITGVNENGFSSTLFEITGVSGTLTVSADSANWNANARLVLSSEDPWGSWTLTGGFVLWMGW